MKIVYNNTESMSDSRIFSDYINNYAKVSSFYPSHFKNEAAWKNAMTGVTTSKRDYGELLEILKRQNLEFGAPQAVMENIDKLADPAFAIVTGQQVGVFTGPLYTIYKAMTAIKLAQHFHDELGAEFVPIFWMESNDHDLAEANHINLLDSKSELKKLEYMPENYRSGCSMKDVLIDDSFPDLIIALGSFLPNTEFKEDVFRIIRESYLPGKSLSYGFGRMMAQLFGKYGLVLFDASDPDAKQLMLPILRREIEFPLESVRIVNSAGERLKSMGYESQIEKSWDSTSLFMEEDGIRRKLFFRENSFIVEGSNKTLNVENLLAILQAEPWRFSPNVAFRPVVQDYIFPTVAYIAGPGETSYFAQLADLYKFMDVNMPVIYPRISLTVVESKVERIMEKNHLSLEDLSEDYNKLFSRLSRDAAAEKLEQILASSKSEINNTFERLATGLGEFDPSLKDIVESTRRKVDHQINTLEERAYKAQRSRDDILREQIKRACMNIYPDGKPQERVFNIVQYLVLYGAFVDIVL